MGVKTIEGHQCDTRFTSVYHTLLDTWVILGNIIIFSQWSYREIWTACGQNDFVRVHALSLGGQCTIHQRTAFQEAVEHRDQRVLMVVPSQAELLLLLLLMVIHSDPR